MLRSKLQILNYKQMIHFRRTDWNNSLQQSDWNVLFLTIWKLLSGFENNVKSLHLNVH